MIREVEMLNIVIASLLWITARRSSVGYCWFLLFVMATLHFSFAAFPVLFNSTAEVLIEYHQSGGGVIAKLAGFLFLVYVIARMRKGTGRTGSQRGWIFSLSIALIVLGYILNLEVGNVTQLKNIVATGLLIGMIVWGGNRLERERLDHDRTLTRVNSTLLILAAICFILAMYEVLSQNAWARFVDSYGETVYRGSATLFNPNVLGIWSVIVLLWAAFQFHSRYVTARYCAALVFLASSALFFSGSRSALYIVCGILMVIGVLVRERGLLERWFPVLIVVTTFIAWGGGAELVERYGPGAAHGSHTIVVLSKRFSSHAGQIAHYAAGSGEVSKEVAASVEGRYIGKERDSGVLVLYDDAGLVGLSGLGLLGAYLVMRGVRVYLIRRDVASLYAISMVVVSTAICVVMRFQVFPVWAFLMIILGLCVAYWNNALRRDCIE